MYGTIARIHVQDGKYDELVDVMKEYEARQIPGMAMSHVYRADNDPNECWIAVAFHSRESYLANAQSREQHARYEKMRALLTSDPEWHDGAIVAVHL